MKETNRTETKHVLLKIKKKKKKKEVIKKIKK